HSSVPDAGGSPPPVRRCLQSDPAHPDGEEVGGALPGVVEKRRHSRMSEVRRWLLLFARHPIVGGMKTRLIPALGAEGAAALHPSLNLSEFVEARKSVV